MSMEDITIYRQIPIINNRIVSPYNSHNYVAARTAEATISGSEISNLTMGSGRSRGSNSGAQEFLVLPGVRPDQWYAVDPQSGLNYK